MQNRGIGICDAFGASPRTGVISLLGSVGRGAGLWFDALGIVAPDLGGPRLGRPS